MEVRGGGGWAVAFMFDCGRHVAGLDAYPGIDCGSMQHAAAPLKISAETSEFAYQARRSHTHIVSCTHECWTHEAAVTHHVNVASDSVMCARVTRRELRDPAVGKLKLAHVFSPPERR